MSGYRNEKSCLSSYHLSRACAPSSSRSIKRPLPRPSLFCSHSNSESIQTRQSCQKFVWPDRERRPLLTRKVRRHFTRFGVPTGPLPPGLERLASLQELRLNHNYLSGSIPDDALNNASLVLVDLSSNGLEGEVSTSTKCQMERLSCCPDTIVMHYHGRT